MIIYTHMYYMHPFPGVILPDSQGKSIWWYLDPPAKLPVVISLRCHGVKAGRAAGGKCHLLQKKHPLIPAWIMWTISSSTQAPTQSRWKGDRLKHVLGIFAVDIWPNITVEYAIHS